MAVVTEVAGGPDPDAVSPPVGLNPHLPAARLAGAAGMARPVGWRVPALVRRRPVRGGGLAGRLGLAARAAPRCIVPRGGDSPVRRLPPLARLCVPCGLFPGRLLRRLGLV